MRMSLSLSRILDCILARGCEVFMHEKWSVRLNMSLTYGLLSLMLFDAFVILFLLIYVWEKFV